MHLKEADITLGCGGFNSTKQWLDACREYAIFDVYLHNKDTSLTRMFFYAVACPGIAILTWLSALVQTMAEDTNLVVDAKDE